METDTGPRFSSRLGLILSVLGIAVGTGNIWRFPRIAASNSGEEGAGAFLLAWLVFLFVWSIPLIVAEYALGRKGRMGVIGSIARVAGRRYGWMGAFIGFVATAIMFYYSVVAGWCLYYVTQMVARPLPVSFESSSAVWEGFQASGLPVVFHGLAMLVGGVVVVRGIRSIERVNKVLIPLLITIVLLAVLRALTLPGAWEGVAFLFTPDWSTLAEPRIWLEALTQNAWDTGAGWGLILTYGAYMQHRHGVVKNAFVTGIGNNTVSILAGVMVFGTVFATLGAQLTRPEIIELMQTSGPAATGLTFIWMPQLFAKMPLGSGLAILFFLGLSFAAISSLISMVELATRVLVDLGFERSTAVVSVCSAGFLFGIPSALHLGFFGNQDFVWGVALMLSGAFIAWSVTRYGSEAFRAECVDDSADDWRAGAVWKNLIRFAVPLQAVILLGWWLFQSATIYAPATWYDPFDPYSVMTVLLQWALVLGALLAANRWLVWKTLGPEDTQ